MQTFLYAPTRYLPNTPFYAGVNATAIAGLLGREVNGTLYRPPQNDPLNSPEAHVYAVMSVIQGFSGAWIPSVEQALALVQSALPLIQTDVGPTVKSQIPGMMQYADALKKVQTVDGLILDKLFEFEYVYCAVAVIYICDCLIKGLQAGKAHIRARLPTLTVRFATGVMLIGVQVLYLHYSTYPSWGVINGGMPILASVMIGEIAVQMTMDWYLARARTSRERRDDEATMQFWQQKGEKGRAAMMMEEDQLGDEESTQSQSSEASGEDRLAHGPEPVTEQDPSRLQVPHAHPPLRVRPLLPPPEEPLGPPKSWKSRPAEVRSPGRHLRKLSHRLSPKPYDGF